MTTPTELTAPVALGDRTIQMRMLSDSQMAALLDFQRQAELLERMPDGEDKNKRAVTLARRCLLMTEKLIVDPDDWDWAMDSMITGELDFPELTSLPARLLDSLVEQAPNRAARRSVAKATRTQRK